MRTHSASRGGLARDEDLGARTALRGLRPRPRYRSDEPPAASIAVIDHVEHDPTCADSYGPPGLLGFRPQRRAALRRRPRRPVTVPTDGRMLSYPRQQQYRRLARAGVASMLSMAAVPLVLLAAASGVPEIAAVLLSAAVVGGSTPATSPDSLVVPASARSPRAKSGELCCRSSEMAGSCANRFHGTARATSTASRSPPPASPSRSRRRLAITPQRTSPACATSLAG